VPGPRVSAQTHRCPKFGPQMGVSSPPDTFGSARWELFFQPLCPVRQKRTRGVRLGRPRWRCLKLPGIGERSERPGVLCLVNHVGTQSVMEL
jgi:hypothetical protein